MRSRRRPELQLLVLAALVAAAVLTVNSSRSRHELPAPAAPATWRGLVGDAHQPISLGQRLIVVLRTPSVGQRLARKKLATEQDERRWAAQAHAAQQQVLTQLARHGLVVRPDYSYVRVLDGFAAPLDPRAVALLGHNPEVAGIYPVRAAFPASISSAALAQGDALAGSAVELPGFDGNGVLIALLDTGVDRFQTYLGGRVQPGIDVVGGKDTADAQPKPQSPLEVERHGTELAGLLVGAGGPGGIHGAAPGATVLPIRVAGWQSDGQGHEVVYARSDQLIAGLDRAVDPNGDGDAHDAARVALVGVAEPFAGFADSPEAQAVAGALALDMLVVAPAGNDGVAGPWFGSIAGPGGSPAALTVGATDPRPVTSSVRVVLRRGLDVLLDESVPLLGVVAPSRPLDLAVALPRSRTGGDARFFDRTGRSIVAGRAALIAAGIDPNANAVRAAKAGASAVLLYGLKLPAGSLASAGDLGVPVVGVPPAAARTLISLIRLGVGVGAALGRAKTAPNEGLGRVAPFSSRGLSFGGLVEPELSAPGIGIATSDPGSAADGEPAFATVNGTSVAAAAVAGAAALLAQERPGLTAPDLASLLVGSTRPAGARLTAGGTGVVDVGASSVGEVTASQTSLAFGTWSGPRWKATRALTIRNVSSRRLVIGFTSAANVSSTRLTLKPGRLVLSPGHEARVLVTARASSRPGAAIATGLLAVRPLGAQALRVPWAIGFRQPAGSLLGQLSLDRTSFKPSDVRPAVLQVQIGRLAGVRRIQIQPAARLDVLLYTGNGAFIGRLTRLRDLLPGTYSFGITGRGPGGAILSPGSYELRLVAWPTGVKRPSRVQIGFRID
jgi:subtilisin family serine protease